MSFKLYFNRCILYNCVTTKKQNLFSTCRCHLGESMNVPEIYGLRNSLSESNSSLSNSSINGSCVGTFTVTPTSSPDDSPMLLNTIPFSQISTMSSLSNALSTPVKGFNSLQVNFGCLYDISISYKLQIAELGAMNFIGIVFMWCHDY